MEYRKLGRTGLDVSAIGLGTEHLEHGRENMDRVLRTAVDAGISFVDVLYVDPTGDDAGFWDGFGPEVRACRDRLVLAAHWGTGSRYEPGYCERCFDEVLARVGNGYVEVAMLTMVDTDQKWRAWVPETAARLRRYREQGRVGHVGLSTHSPRIALAAVNSGLVDVLMYPLNLTSHAVERDGEVVEACAASGVGLVAMKPYRGGTLLVADGKPSGISPAQCLAYVLSLPVSTTVPGARNADELRATLRYLEATEEARDFRPLLPDARRHLMGGCTHCDHCLPCPVGIDIGQTIGLVDWTGWARRDTEEGAEVWAAYAALPVKAAACNECGVCQERCPFEVDVVAKMRRAVEVFEAAASRE